MTEWWYGVGFIAAVVLAFTVKLLPYVQQMMRWREERGLDRYDPKQFVDVEADQGRETAGGFGGLRGLPGRKK